MKKWFGSAVVLAMCLFSVGGIAPAKAAEPVGDAIQVKLENEAISFDVPPMLMENRTMVPLRKVMEALDYEVSWDEERQLVTAVKDSAYVKVDVGASRAYLGSATAQLSVPVQMVQDRTMVPLRFIAAAAGYDVFWDGDSNTVYIENPNPDRTQAPRQYQNIAMLGTAMMWTDGKKISMEQGIYEEEPHAYTNSLQVEDGFLYYHNSAFYLCRENIQTGEEQQVTAVPVGVATVAGGHVYYSKQNDRTHSLYRANLDGSGETLVIESPCGDYRVMGDKIYYIHMHNNKLLEYSMETGETKTIYDGYTTCLDISSDQKVYYGMSEYKNERTPLRYLGIGCYDSKTAVYESMEAYRSARAAELWIVGSRLFYQTPPEEGPADLYRCNLQHGYQVKLLSGISGAAEIHGNYIFYYPADESLRQDGRQPLYITDICASETAPLFSLIRAAGNTEQATLTVSASEKFSAEEIQAAINTVLESFKGFGNCTLTELWYEEKQSNRVIESYMQTGRGAYNGAQPENVIVLFSHFNTADNAPGGLSSNMRYTDWNWILVRESKDAPWKLDDCGY